MTPGSMLSLLRTLIKPNITPLNTIQLSGDALLRNLHYLQSLKPGDQIFPVLKSNAYGHGLKQVSTILKDLQNTDLSYICVDSFPEYQIVRDYAHKKSLIIGETRPENYTYYDHRRATPCVYNIETLKALIATRRPWKIHLFLNTGMNREGIQDRELSSFLKLLSGSRIQLEGVMSHFANADEHDWSFCDTQIHRFKEMYTQISPPPSCSKAKAVGRGVWGEGNVNIKYRHIGNSAGIFRIDDPFFTAWRSGLAFYGYDPLPVTSPKRTPSPSGSEAKAIGRGLGGGCDSYGLRPALTVTSTITAIQHLQPGELVSYTGSYRANRPTTVATIPFGYAEGLDRKLSNQRTVRHIKSGAIFPLIGNICMNLSCIDAGTTDIQLGDQIALISSAGENDIYTFAKKIGTIPYEVLVRLGTGVRRDII